MDNAQFRIRPALAFFAAAFLAAASASASSSMRFHGNGTGVVEGVRVAHRRPRDVPTRAPRRRGSRGLHDRVLDAGLGRGERSGRGDLRAERRLDRGPHRRGSESPRTPTGSSASRSRAAAWSSASAATGRATARSAARVAFSTTPGITSPSSAGGRMGGCGSGSTGFSTPKRTGRTATCRIPTTPPPGAPNDPLPRVRRREARRRGAVPLLQRVPRRDPRLDRPALHELVHAAAAAVRSATGIRPRSIASTKEPETSSATPPGPPEARRTGSAPSAARPRAPTGPSSVAAPLGNGDAVEFTLVTGGLSEPVQVTQAPNDSTRLFIVEQGE